jgi:hypothetical protein
LSTLLFRWFIGSRIRSRAAAFFYHFAARGFKPETPASVQRIFPHRNKSRKPSDANRAAVFDA